jgi:hypothetical protein
LAGADIIHKNYENVSPSGRRFGSTRFL